MPEVIDADGGYLAWMQEGGHAVFVARPDFYLYGTSASIDGLPALLTELAGQLGMLGVPV